MSTIALIACCKSKDFSLDAQPARKVYTGQLFRAQLAYACQRLPDGQIYILSAKYGLLALDELILPYEQTLNRMDAAERYAWAWDVDVTFKYRCPEAKMVWMMAGKKYREYLVKRLEERGIEIVRPHPAGLGYGQQVKWYQQQVNTIMPKPCSQCRAECAYSYRQDAGELCWGEVDPVEDFGEYGFLHACQGHKDFYGEGIYEYPPMAIEVKRGT